MCHLLYIQLDLFVHTQVLHVVSSKALFKTLETHQLLPPSMLFLNSVRLEVKPFLILALCGFSTCVLMGLTLSLFGRVFPTAEHFYVVLAAKLMLVLIIFCSATCLLRSLAMKTTSFFTNLLATLMRLSPIRLS